MGTKKKKQQNFWNTKDNIIIVTILYSCKSMSRSESHNLGFG